jgi:DNA-binding CsgD family transcriptional regulator
VLEQVGAVVPAATLLAAMRREPASAHHVPMLDDLAHRLDERLDADERRECRTLSAGLDLFDAATYAREHLAARIAEADRSRHGGAPGGLTRRELDVVRLVVEGHTTKEIARRLFISAKTADHHIQHIYTKVGVSNRVAVARWAIEQGIVADAGT